MSIIRTIALICFFGPLSAMLVEPFFAELFDRIEWDTEDFVVPFMSWVAENTAILLGLMGAGGGVWLHYFAQKYSKIRPEREDSDPIRGGYTSRLKVVFDPGSGHPRRIENKNVSRFYFTGTSRNSYLFLAFEKPVGVDGITLRHNDGGKLLFEVIDIGENSIVIKLDSPINSSGILFECGNDLDVMKPSIGAGPAPQLLEVREEEKPH